MATPANVNPMDQLQTILSSLNGIERRSSINEKEKLTAEKMPKSRRKSVSAIVKKDKPDFPLPSVPTSQQRLERYQRLGLFNVGPSDAQYLHSINASLHAASQDAEQIERVFSQKDKETAAWTSSSSTAPSVVSASSSQDWTTQVELLRLNLCEAVESLHLLQAITAHGTKVLSQIELIVAQSRAIQQLAEASGAKLEPELVETFEKVEEDGRKYLSSCEKISRIIEKEPSLQSSITLQEKASNRLANSTTKLIQTTAAYINAIPVIASGEAYLSGPRSQPVLSRREKDLPNQLSLQVPNRSQNSSKDSMNSSGAESSASKSESRARNKEQTLAITAAENAQSSLKTSKEPKDKKGSVEKIPVEKEHKDSNKASKAPAPEGLKLHKETIVDKEAIPSSTDASSHERAVSPLQPTFSPPGVRSLRSERALSPQLSKKKLLDQAVTPPPGDAPSEKKAVPAEKPIDAPTDKAMSPKSTERKHIVSKTDADIIKPKKSLLGDDESPKTKRSPLVRADTDSSLGRSLSNSGKVNLFASDEPDKPIDKQEIKAKLIEPTKKFRRRAKSDNPVLLNRNTLVEQEDIVALPTELAVKELHVAPSSSSLYDPVESSSTARPRVPDERLNAVSDSESETSHQERNLSKRSSFEDILQLIKRTFSITDLPRESEAQRQRTPPPEDKGLVRRASFGPVSSSKPKLLASKSENSILMLQNENENEGGRVVKSKSFNTLSDPRPPRVNFDPFVGKEKTKSKSEKSPSTSDRLSVASPSTPVQPPPPAPVQENSEPFPPAAPAPAPSPKKKTKEKNSKRKPKVLVSPATKKTEVRISTDEENARLAINQLEPSDPPIHIVPSPLTELIKAASTSNASTLSDTVEFPEVLSPLTEETTTTYLQGSNGVIVDPLKILTEQHREEDEEQIVVSPLFKGMVRGDSATDVVVKTNPLYRNALSSDEELVDLESATPESILKGKFKSRSTMPRKSMDWRILPPSPNLDQSNDSNGGAQISRFGSRRLSRGSVAIRTTSQPNAPSSPKASAQSPTNSVVDVSNLSAQLVGQLPNGKTLRVNEGGRDIIIIEKVLDKTELIAADADKIIEQLADENTQDLEFVDAILLTHSQFITSEDLFDQLVERFHINVPADASEDDIRYFKQHQSSIQLNVLNVISRWLKNQWSDFDNSEALIDMVDQFVDDLRTSGFTEAERLSRTLSQQMSKVATSERKSSAMALKRKEQPVFTASDSTLFLNMDPLTVARQLSRNDLLYYKNITAQDFLRHLMNASKLRRYGSKESVNDFESAASVEKFLHRSEQITHWVVLEVVSLSKMKARRIAIAKLIRLAKMCRDYNNFNAAFAIINGLYLPPVRRLKRTWEGIPSKELQILGTMNKLMDPVNNMKVYREVLDTSKPPVVPFFPIALRELLYIHERNNTMVEDGLINVKKLRMMASMIFRYVSLQNQTYPFEKQETVSNYIEERIEWAPSEEQLAQMSHECDES